ncbi:hypothetical protein PMES_03286 [Profundibacterium mesophilum KAUST100406-0324]|uniref:Uncharacterized protein n=1 Tax=Profundibacterium mesophilum KAUST100406-0324 TaxID=1037889 RepID=A0A921NTE8_9RHOB|nr:hypothetical protein PMES_03286 [Profundibacterium mesophilum KAUST100406-0324]
MRDISQLPPVPAIDFDDPTFGRGLIVELLTALRAAKVSPGGLQVADLEMLRARCADIMVRYDAALMELAFEHDAPTGKLDKAVVRALLAEGLEVLDRALSLNQFLGYIVEFQLGVRDLLGELSDLQAQGGCVSLPQASIDSLEFCADEVDGFTREFCQAEGLSDLLDHDGRLHLGPLEGVIDHASIEASDG